MHWGGLTEVERAEEWIVPRKLIWVRICDAVRGGVIPVTPLIGHPPVWTKL